MKNSIVVMKSPKSYLDAYEDDGEEYSTIVLTNKGNYRMECVDKLDLLDF